MRCGLFRTPFLRFFEHFEHFVCFCLFLAKLQIFSVSRMSIQKKQLLLLFYAYFACRDTRMSDPHVNRMLAHLITAVIIHSLVACVTATDMLRDESSVSRWPIYHSRDGHHIPNAIGHHGSDRQPREGHQHDRARNNKKLKDCNNN